MLMRGVESLIYIQSYAKQLLDGYNKMTTFIHFQLLI